MAQTRKSRPDRSPVQPLPERERRPRRRDDRRRPQLAEPLQSTLRPPQTVRRPLLSLPAARPARLPAVAAAAVPPRRAASLARALRRHLRPVGRELVPNLAREYIGGAAAEIARGAAARVRRVAAPFAGRRIGVGAAGRRPTELEHRDAKTQGAGARDASRDAAAKRRSDQQLMLTFTTRIGIYVTQRARFQNVRGGRYHTKCNNVRQRRVYFIFVKDFIGNVATFEN